MKRCKEYRSELAACAAMQMEPAEEIAAHLGECARCRAVLEELCRASEQQVRTAKGLSEAGLFPRKFSFDELRKSADARTPAVLWRPLVYSAGAVALLLTAVLVFNSPKAVRKAAVEVLEPPVLQVNTELEPTWGTLRKQIAENREISMASAPTTSQTRHIQLKDVYLETE